MAGVVLAAMVLGALAIPAVDRDSPPAETNLEVELPEAEPGLAEAPTGQAAPSSTPTAASDFAPFACEPEGCARWNARIGPGDYAVSDGEILQASTTAVRALDPATGRTRWRVTYNEDGLPPILGRPRVEPLGDDLILVTAGGLVQVRSTESGELRWHVDLEVDHVLDHAEHGDVLVVAGWPLRERQHPPVRVAAFDRGEGALRWDRTVHRAVTLASDPLVVQPRNGSLLALDPRTGVERWTRSLTGPVRGLVDDGILSLITATGIEVVDPATGDSRRSVPRSVSDAGLTHLVAGLLVVDAPSDVDPIDKPRSDMTVVALNDEGSQPRRYPDTTGIHPLDDGLVIVTQTADERTLHRIDGQGTPRWSTTRPVGEACCWTVQGSGETDSVYLVPPQLYLGPVEVVDLADGTTRRSFAVSITQALDPVEWVDGFGVERRARRSVVSGPGGHIEAAADAWLLTGDPHPVLVVEEGLLGLDPDVLLSQER